MVVRVDTQKFFANQCNSLPNAIELLLGIPVWAVLFLFTKDSIHHCSSQMQCQRHKINLKIGMNVNIVAGRYARKSGTVTGLTEKMVYIQLADENIVHIRIMKSSVKPLVFDTTGKYHDTTNIGLEVVSHQKPPNIPFNPFVSVDDTNDLDNQSSRTTELKTAESAVQPKESNSSLFSPTGDYQTESIRLFMPGIKQITRDQTFASFLFKD